MRFSALMMWLAGKMEVGEIRVGSDPEIVGVCEDSRKVRAGDLFVARNGTKRSGGEFAREAVGRGAVAVVCERGQWPVVSGQLEGKGVAVAGVENVNLAAALLAHEVAGRPTEGMKVIGVTGTKGKTTVAYLLRSVLKAAGGVVGMVGTVEIDDGKEAVAAEMTTPGAVELVELFKRMRGNGVTHCVMEVSSHALHQHRVAGIDFAVGVFTNLTGDHLDYHGTMEEYGKAKRILFEGLKEGAVAVVNVDDEWGERMVEGCKAKVVRHHVEMGLDQDGLKTAKRPEGGWSGLVTRMAADGMRMNLQGPDAVREEGSALRYMYKMETPLVGLHNAYNLTSVVAAAFALGMPDGEFMKGIRVLENDKGAPGRLQRVECEGDFQVFVDYAHTHDSLENVLSAVRTVMGKEDGGVREHAQGPYPEHGTRGGRLICVFGCGGDRDRTKRPKMAAVAEKCADKVFVTSDNPRTEDPAAIIDEIKTGFRSAANEKIIIEADRRAAIRAAIGEAKKGDVVVIAGKGHENYQIIGTTKFHFDDVEEAEAALAERFEIRKLH